MVKLEGLETSGFEKKVCEKIHYFILFELPDKIDKRIFEKSSILAVGQYLFDIVLCEVDDASEELINLVIERTGKKNAIYSSQEDYYEQLCSFHMHFKKLPKSVYFEVIRKYVSIFRRKYPRLCSEIENQISKINDELDRVEDQVNSTIHSSNTSKLITKDIKSIESTLSSLYRECDELRAKKEMLNFLLGYLDECMAKFCDLTNTTEVREKLSRVAIMIATEMSLGIESEFQYFEEIICIAKEQAKDIFRNFYIVKLLKSHEEVRKKVHVMACWRDGIPSEVLDEAERETDRIPRVDELICAKNTDKQEYKELLSSVIFLNGAIQGLRDQINNCVSIGKRKTILFKLIDLFEQGEFDLFNNTVPIQIEGLFGDFLKEGIVFYRFTNMQLHYHAVLREKINYIKGLGVDIYPEAMMYFGFYFNNLIRNKIAHGTYSYENNEDAEIFAIELLLDLECLVYMISRKSETEKMYRILHNYKSGYEQIFKNPNYHFGFLYNDLTGQRMHSTFDAVDQIRPIQFAYWLLNPYYEELFGRMGDVVELQELRTDILSNDFWMFVLDELDKAIAARIGKISIDREFCSIIKCLFQCDITKQTKATLGQINAKLSLLFAE